MTDFTEKAKSLADDYFSKYTVYEVATKQEYDLVLLGIKAGLEYAAKQDRSKMKNATSPDYREAYFFSAEEHDIAAQQIKVEG